MKLCLRNIALLLREFILEADLILESPATAVFGPSGAGKTSLLELIAGLRRPASAFIELDGVVLTDTRRRLDLPARLRRVGYVPQDLALFPHLNVRNNLLYGSNDGSDESLFSFERVVEALEIAPFLDGGVGGLSGGEQQRVALARALLASPRLLLLDEPLASLDAALKARILPYLARVRDEFRVPMLYVTHDRAEARKLCEEVVEIRRGRVAQQIKTKDWNE